MFGFEKKNLLLIFFLFFLSLFVGLFSLRYGGKTIPFYDLFTHQNSLLVVHLRLPRILADFMVGAGLSIVGLSFQTLVRNPLAEPYLFGISGAAALGYVLGSIFLSGVYSYALSFLLSVFTVFFVMFFALKDRENAPSSMVLTGVAVGFFYSSIISVMSIFLSSRFVKNIFLWYLGDTTGLTLNSAIISLFVVTFLSALMFFDAEKLNIYGVGEEFAQTSGVNIKSLIYRQYVLGSLITAVVVSKCGAIGFVGLIVPHIVKTLFGKDNKLNFALTFFLGGMFLIIVDTLIKSIVYPMEIPIGVITAMIGSPFLILLMRKFRYVER